MIAIPLPVRAAEYHVALQGNDSNHGSKRTPLRTIQRAAELAQPGDVITVHEGVYRERINPPRGGSSEKKRILYRATPGEHIEIKGSEEVKNWTRVEGEVWKVVLPNSFFGSFNPYTNVIHGDWFEAKGRVHHTGAVYLDGDWHVEATSLDEVLASPDHPPAWLTQGGGSYLLNLAWFRPVAEKATRVPAASFVEKRGMQTAACSEGGECLGWVESGHWARYQRVDFGPGADQVEIRASSATAGGIIQIREDSAQGELLGTCSVPNTGEWQSWASLNAPIKRVSGTKTICLVFGAPKAAARADKFAKVQLWFSQVDARNTTIWAQFKGVNPNERQVEINVRQTVFYPDKPNRNYITIRGFTMRHAATPWAPPTAEQIGLVGTHWSKGWIIENNTVSHSICSGIALGKHGDQYDNTSANTAEGYVKTIERGLQNGWNRETIGHHTVRSNSISHCEQTGVVGSLGASFSTVAWNDIHDIHTRQLFTGAEMAGIKFHAAIDTVIRNNHIHRTCLGLWLDWMAQGTRVSANLFNENGRDLFVEVDHGPFVVDNNLFLSDASLLDVSEGGAYLHNLFCGSLVSSPEPNRETPFHPAHSTTMAGLKSVKGGDCRFYNNVFIGRGGSSKGAAAYGLSMYDRREYPLFTGGNVFYNGARPYARETGPVIVGTTDPGFAVTEQRNEIQLSFSAGPELQHAGARLVDTAMLGKAIVPGLPYENADGTPLKIVTDYLGKKRVKPSSGPFENPGEGKLSVKVW